MFVYIYYTSFVNFLDWSYNVTLQGVADWVFIIVWWHIWQTWCHMKVKLSLCSTRRR